MAKKIKKKSGSKKKKSNVFTTVIVVILVIILAFFVISKFLISNNNNTDNQEVKPDISVNGAWMSSYDQSTLIIKDGKYAIYLSGIERDHPIVGKYSVKGNEVTFVNKKDPCEGAKGLYEVSFNAKNIVFKYVDDGCSKRKSIFLHDWEWLDTDMNDITIE